MSLKQCCALGRCAVTKELKACAACSEVVYCSRDHQVEHFKEGGHKMICPGRSKGNPLTFQQCAEKAQKYHKDQMWLAALPYYSAMLELTERTVGLFHEQVANILEVMATCYKMLQKFDFAAECLQRVLIVRELYNEEGSKEKSKKSFVTMGQLSELYMSAGNLELAKELLKKTEESAKEVFGENSFERGQALCALGGCLERNNETDDAIQTLKDAIAIKAYSESKEKREMISASNCFFNLGVLSHGRSENPVALVNFKKAYELKIKGGLPADHPDIIETKEYISKVDT